MQQRLHAWVSGRVQGVGFRYFVHQLASHLGLNGWVRNLPDGRVETLAEGEMEALEALLTGLKRGPGGARVQEVKTDWAPASGEFDRFDIEHW
ncbi:MAG: acylphosphatase [Anaerolineaceae bacterium]|nr:acylphosphatase [Anaerolineaceae bacterium]